MYDYIPQATCGLVILYIAAVGAIELLSWKDIRALFTQRKWPHPGYAIPVYLGLALAMGSLAQNAHSTLLVHLGFGMTYVFLLLALLWGLNAVITVGEHKIRGTVLSCLAFVVLACVTALYHIDKARSLNPTPFHAALDLTYWGSDEPQGAVNDWWVVHGDTACSAKVVLFVDLTNLQNVASTVDHIEFGIRRRAGNYVKFPMIMHGGADIYMGPDMKHLTRLRPELTPLFDDAVFRTLQPHVPVGGFVLLDTPDQMTHLRDFSEDFKLEIRDFGGINFVSAPIPEHAEPSDHSIWLAFTTDVRDISNLKILQHCGDYEW